MCWVEVSPLQCGQVPFADAEQARHQLGPGEGHYPGQPRMTAATGPVGAAAQLQPRPPTADPGQRGRIRHRPCQRFVDHTSRVVASRRMVTAASPSRSAMRTATSTTSSRTGVTRGSNEPAGRPGGDSSSTLSQLVSATVVEPDRHAVGSPDVWLGAASHAADQHVLGDAVLSEKLLRAPAINALRQSSKDFIGKLRQSLSPKHLDDPLPFDLLRRHQQPPVLRAD
jgi:hypothetical protein